MNDPDLLTVMTHFTPVFDVSLPRAKNRAGLFLHHNQ